MNKLSASVAIAIQAARARRSQRPRRVVAGDEVAVLILPFPQPCSLCPFCHDTTLQHHRLPSVTTTVTRPNYGRVGVQKSHRVTVADCQWEGGPKFSERPPGTQPSTWSRLLSRRLRRCGLSAWWRILAPELPHYPEDDPLLPFWQAGALPQYGVRGLVSETLHDLLVENRRPLAPAHEVGGRDPEDGRESRDLTHGGVGYFPCPHPLDLALRETARAHSGHLGVRVGLLGPRVHDGFEEVPDPPGEVLALRGGGLRPVPGRVLEPRLRWEAHGPGDRQYLLVARVLYAALAEVREVGAGHDAARGLVELLACSGAPVRAAVGIEETLEPLRYVQCGAPGGILRII